MRLPLTLLLLPLVLAMNGCSANPATHYLGHWQNTSNPTDTFEIVANGDSCLLLADKKNFVTGRAERLRIPARVSDGLLRIEGAASSQVLAYNEATDTLTTQGLVGKLEYRRSVPNAPSPGS